MSQQQETRGSEAEAGHAQGGGRIAAAMAVMNVATYAFQLLAARLLGPESYSAFASLMALLLVVGVLQLGLQATGARRIAAHPGQVARVEREVLAVTYRWAALLGAVMLVASPLVYRLLRLDSLLTAVVLALAVVPMTIMGGQAGVLQGERRWLPLALLYLGVGVPRLAIGLVLVLAVPDEAAAMTGVLLGLLVPCAVGWWALRHPREEAPEPLEGGRSLSREVLHNSQALLAFFVLSNLDIVVARNVLPPTEAGLYAAGLILTKAVLFLPQFVVVVAFPAMSTTADRRRALGLSLGAVAVAGAACTLGAWLLSGLAIVFVGGSAYADLQSHLWWFAVIGTLLSMLQLVVYSVLARQGTRSPYVTWLGAAALVVGAGRVDTLPQLVALVTVVDTVVLVLLLAATAVRLRDDRTGTVEAADGQDPPATA